MSFYPFVLHEISVLNELTLGHLRYRLADVPPQPNSPNCIPAPFRCCTRRHFAPAGLKLPGFLRQSPVARGIRLYLKQKASPRLPSTHNFAVVDAGTEQVGFPDADKRIILYLASR